jgi:hypothetical protein
MNAPYDQREMKPVLAPTLHLLVAIGAGLLLGALGDKLAWNRLENPWPYLGLLCPLLLGMIVGLTGGGRDWPPVPSVLAWTGFYLTFVFIPFQRHPYQVINPSPADASPAGPFCSPCFSPDSLLEVEIVFFWVVGLYYVPLIAFATSSLLKFARRIRSKSEAPE